MRTDLRLLDLLDGAFDSGLDPEACCAGNPDLAPELRRELAACERLSDELEAMFPVRGWEPEPPAEAPPDALPTIAGYEVMSVLGFGGMGVVYRARHLALDRQVALKMMIAGGRSAAVERERIKREAESLAKTRHAHIVQVFDVGELDGIPYFTMEIMEGGSLCEKLRGVPQPADYAAGTMVELAGAVEAAHRCGIIHRDLKPANVLLTLDGVPKMSDFGLARWMEGDDLLTLPGTRMGTPSYMAPEQASGRFGEVGRAADVYALGAILYEMMTGRPPFRGESAADTERQLLHDEVVPPTRLNPRAPRDLETICLKCLQKVSARRYASAAEVADDLARWRRGVPILARRTGRVERALKLARRRPAETTAVVASLLLVLSVGGGALSLASQRAAAAVTVAAAEADVGEAISLQRQGKMDRAAGALTRAEERLRGLGGRAPARVRDMLAAAGCDQALVDALDKAWVASQPILNDTPDRSRSSAAFADVFSGLGIGTFADDPKVVGAKIRASNVKPAILAALDKWSSSEVRRPRADWIAAVACAAEPDPTGWREQVRQLRSPGADGRLLADLAERADVARQPVALLTALGLQMKAAGMDPIPYFTRVVRARPGDAWANFAMGELLRGAGKYHLAVEYCRAAVALQPRLLAMQIALADTLRVNGRIDEAMENLRAAAAADPAQWFYPLIRSALLMQSGRHPEALAAANEAQRLAPPAEALPPLYQAKVLARLGRNEEALAKVQLAVSLDSTSIEAQRDRRAVLTALGRTDELQRSWRDAIALNPPAVRDWDGYAELCLYRGDVDAYRRVRSQLLDKFGEVTDARQCECIGRACLILPASPDELQRATALIDRALSDTSPSAPAYRSYFALAKALADYRAGRYQEALTSVERRPSISTALRPTQTLIAAMAHRRLGHTEAALAKLRDAAVASEWSSGRASSRDSWMNHAFRREAERLIIPNLQAFLDGVYEPQAADERVALTAVCQEAGRTAAEARLWAAALAQETNLADPYRGAAIRATALAGCGVGTDAADPGEADRTAWRQIARRLAGDQLDAAERLIAGRDAPKRAAGVALATKAAAQLSPLRDRARIANLSSEEVDACQKLFARAEGLAATTNDRPTPSPLVAEH